MAVTTTHINLQITKWRTAVYREFRRGNALSPYMGESPTSIIQVLRDLRDGGDQVVVPIVGGLNGPGVSTGPLTGNEEKLDQYGMKLWVDWSRNAVLLTRAQMRKSAIEQLELVRPLLTEWGNVLIRDELILAMHSLPSEAPPVNLGNEATAGQRVNGIMYDNASAAQKNTWHDNNSDRILYGAGRANFVGGNHASSLANVDAVNDKASAAILMMAKRMARKASPGITPYRDNEDQGREWYVVFVGSNAYRDLAADPVIYNANLNARPREGNGVDRNPIFNDGDLLYRGMIIREVPEIDQYLTVTGAGASAINVAPLFVCGQNALALAWGQMPRPTERREDDYGFLIGRGVEMVFGVGKVFKADPLTPTKLVQWGMVTVYVASVDDA
jgi:hypothetical protein